MARILLFVLFLFFNLSKGSIEDIDWSTLNADTLNAVAPPEFSSVNSTILSSIPSVAFAGLLPVQVLFIEDFAFNGLGPTQLTNITNLGTIKAFGPGQIGNIRQSTLRAFSSSQIGALSPNGCEGITADFFRGITADSYSGFVGTCLSPINSTSFSGISARGLSRIQPQALNYTGLNQLNSLSDGSLVGFTGDQLGNLTLKYQIGFVSLYSVQRWNPSLDSVQSFVQKVGNSVPELLDFSELNAKTSWIELAVMRNSSILSLNSTFISSVNASSLVGFRPDFVPKLTVEGISKITKSQANYLLPIVFGRFSVPQLQAFTPSAFGNLYPLDYFLLSFSSLGQLSDDQIGSIPADTFKNCTFSTMVQQSGKSNVLKGESQVSFGNCMSSLSGGSKLSHSQIAGIVIGSIAALLLAAVLVWFFLIRKRKGYDRINEPLRRSEEF
eukprot:TRINITY_DN2465_c0_g1_i1.p1 TRINITY_DN2465_c0_g1~~TRINITY_DN2465_c0_g1_i1.p1  ORF type:complete len:441 (+),score=140.47 TRINITY_DN2465_c0_g1_i1:57-1379(+)